MNACWNPGWAKLHILTRDGKEPSFIGFGSVRVLVNFFKWRVLVLFGFYDYHGSVRVRVLLGNVTFI